MITEIIYPQAIQNFIITEKHRTSFHFFIQCFPKLTYKFGIGEEIWIIYHGLIFFNFIKFLFLV